MSSTPLVIHLSNLELTLRFRGVPLCEAALRAVWQRAADRTYVPVQHGAAYEIAREDGRVRLDLGPCGVHFVQDDIDAAPIVEEALYREFTFTQRQDGFSVVHGAMLGFRGRPIFIVGHSGAGKSTLARTAVAAGFDYYGDEQFVTDGERAWGIPRAIQMELHREGAPLAPWHAVADLVSYPCRNPQGERFSLPIVHVPSERVGSEALRLMGGVFVGLARGDKDAIEPMDAGARLALLEANVFVRTAALARVALLRTSFALTWKEPARAFDLLGSELESRTDTPAR